MTNRPTLIMCCSRQTYRKLIQLRAAKLHSNLSTSSETFAKLLKRMTVHQIRLSGPNKCFSILSLHYLLSYWCTSAKTFSTHSFIKPMKYTLHKSVCPLTASPLHKLIEINELEIKKYCQWFLAI